MRVRPLTVILTGLVIVLTLASMPALASVAAFYKGKTVTLLVAAGTGGGYDIYGRTLAAALVRHIPGRPHIIVRNNSGGGGLIGANYLYNVAPRNGLWIGGLQRSAPIKAIMREPGPKFDATKFNWLGSLNSEVNVCIVMANTGIKTLDDAKRRSIILGSSGPNDTEMIPAILNNLVGTRFKIISGYPSTVQIGLAMARGEVQGQCSSYSSLISRHPDWFRTKRVHILVQNALTKHPRLPDVPLNREYVTSHGDKAILELSEARLAFGRPYAAPPNVPPARVAALRRAFWAAASDSRFKSEIKRRRRELKPMSGRRVQELIAKLAATPESLVTRLKEVQVFKGERVRVRSNIISAAGVIANSERSGRRIELRRPDGRIVEVTVSAARTRITIAGKSARREALRSGMTCTIRRPANDRTARNIDCR